LCSDGSVAYGTIPDWDTPDLGPPKEPTAAEFIEFLRQEVSSRLRHRLDATFPTDQAVPKSQVLVAVEDLLHELYERLCARWRQENGGSASDAPKPPSDMAETPPQETRADDGVAESEFEAAEVFGDLLAGLEFDEALSTVPEWVDGVFWAQPLSQGPAMGGSMESGEVGVW